MQITIETKGFRPGVVLRNLIRKKLQALTELDVELVCAKFTLLFEEHVFRSNLSLSFLKGHITITLCETIFYDAVTRTVEIAGEFLKVKRDITFAREQMHPEKMYLPKNMEYEFSAN